MPAETAKRFIAGNGHANVDFVPADADRLPFPSESYDLVACRIAAQKAPQQNAEEEHVFVAS